MEMLSNMGSKLKIVFAGTPVNAAQTLQSLHSSGVEILGVVTRTDSVVGRQKTLTPSPVSELATSLGLKVLKTNSLDDAAVSWIKSLAPDLGVVVAYGSIFNKDARDTPKLGWINLHYSLLPDLPGPAPVQHALLLGVSVTGVTVFRLDEGIDSGPIVARSEVAVEEADNAGSLLLRLTSIGSELLSKVLIEGESAITRAVKQEGIAGAYAKKPTRDLAKLDFTKNVHEQLNKVRAMNPEPMAWFESNGAAVRVIKARLFETPLETEALARLVGKELVVDCNGGSLVLEVVQPSGKQEMNGADWFRGLRVETLKLS